VRARFDFTSFVGLGVSKALTRGNLRTEDMDVQTDMLNPAKLTEVKISNVESFELSKVSPMPTGLLDTFRQDEVLDLMAYVMSRGDRKHEMFRR
jgi:hypothetical protein